MVLVGLQAVSFPFALIGAFSPTLITTMKVPATVNATSVAGARRRPLRVDARRPFGAAWAMARRPS
jgi:hypothetical protein